ncbi:MAG: transposase [Terriglobia bacterium]|jgi:hypothetical protein
MGEKQNQPFQLSFNASLKIDFQGSRVTSDGGLILVRELDERLGLGELIAQHLTDPRGTNTRLPLPDLLRQSVYSRLAGYEDGRADRVAALARRVESATGRRNPGETSRGDGEVSEESRENGSSCRALGANSTGLGDVKKEIPGKGPFPMYPIAG